MEVSAKMPHYTSVPAGRTLQEGGVHFRWCVSTGCVGTAGKAMTEETEKANRTEPVDNWVTSAAEG